MKSKKKRYEDMSYEEMIREFRKDPEFKKGIREFVKLTT